MTGGDVVVSAGAGGCGCDGAGAGVSVGAGVGNGAAAGEVDLVVLGFGLALALLFVFVLLGTITTWAATNPIEINRLITHTAIAAVALDLCLSISDLYIILMAPA
jgi:hypothetical protein